jgi:S1-C subfamily serine protease
VTLNGRLIDDSTELVVAVRSNAPGDEVTIEYERNGRRSQQNLILGATPGNG